MRDRDGFGGGEREREKYGGRVTERRREMNTSKLFLIIFNYCLI